MAKNKDNSVAVADEYMGTFDDDSLADPPKTDLPTKSAKSDPAEQQKSKLPKPFSDPVRDAINKSYQKVVEKQRSKSEPDDQDILDNADESDVDFDSPAPKATKKAPVQTEDSFEDDLDTVEEAAAEQRQERPEPDRVKVIVDGKTRYLTQKELVAIAQKNFAADKRLQEASRAREEAERERNEILAQRNALQQNAESTRAQHSRQDANYPQDDDEPTDEELAAIEELQMGDPKSALKALRNIAGRQKQPSLDPQSVRHMMRLERDQEAVSAAMREFQESDAEDFSTPAKGAAVWASLAEVLREDLISLSENNAEMRRRGLTPDAIRTANAAELGKAHQSLRIMGAPLKSPKQTKDEAVARTREEFGLTARERSSGQSSAERPVIDRSTRKANAQHQPRTARGTFDKPPAGRKTPSDIFKEMKSWRPGQKSH